MDNHALNKRVTLFCGHYGSGKTNIAVNCALRLKDCRDRVAIADLDIVNPYFRTKDAADLLHRHGVELIVSEFAGTNLDAPAIIPSIIDCFEFSATPFILLTALVISVLY